MTGEKALPETKVSGTTASVSVTFLHVIKINYHKRMDTHNRKCNQKLVQIERKSASDLSTNARKRKCGMVANSRRTTTIRKMVDEADLGQKYNISIKSYMECLEKDVRVCKYTFTEN